MIQLYVATRVSFQQCSMLSTTLTLINIDRPWLTLINLKLAPGVDSVEFIFYRYKVLRLSPQTKEALHTIDKLFQNKDIGVSITEN